MGRNRARAKRSDEQRAERLVMTELTKRDWAEKELRLRRKGDRIKLQIAQHLRAHCSATIRWITERLQMGTCGHLTHLL